MFSKEGCECVQCLQNELDSWREFASRILRKFSFSQKERWFKTPEGQEYLTETSFLMGKITRTRRLNEKKTKRLQAT